jgi:hypothetical protein
MNAAFDLFRAIPDHLHTPARDVVRCIKADFEPWIGNPDRLIAMVLASDPDDVSSDDALAHTTSASVDRVSPDALDLTCAWYQEHADILETDALDLDRW